jgi:hypothetical protein
MVIEMATTALSVLALSKYQFDNTNFVLILVFTFHL